MPDKPLSETPERSQSRSVLSFPLSKDDILILEREGFIRGAAAGTAYIGAVASNGTAGSLFPAGWSAAKDSTGIYTVTHNLGTTDHWVGITFDDGSVRFHTLEYATNSFKVRAFNISASLTDSSFRFALIPA